MTTGGTAPPTTKGDRERGLRPRPPAPRDRPFALPPPVPGDTFPTKPASLEGFNSTNPIELTDDRKAIQFLRRMEPFNVNPFTTHPASVIGGAHGRRLARPGQRRGPQDHHWLPDGGRALEG